MSIVLETSGFDIALAIDEMSKIGAVSYKVLPEKTRQLLLADAEFLWKAGTNNVELDNWQDEIGEVGMVSCIVEDLSLLDNFRALKSKFQSFLKTQLESLPSYPFSTPLDLNLMELIRYSSRARLTTLHFDSLDVNVACIFILEGRGSFFVCSDIEGNNPIEIDATSGRVILMRGHGFGNFEKTPYHYVRNIQGPRYVLALRQTN